MSPFFVYLDDTISAFAEQVFVHAIVDILHPITVAPTNLGGGPAGEANLLESTAHIRPVDIAVANLAETVRLAPVLNVQHHKSFAKRANPLSRFAKTLMVTNTKQCGFSSILYCSARIIFIYGILGKLFTLLIER